MQFIDLDFGSMNFWMFKLSIFLASKDLAFPIFYRSRLFTSNCLTSLVSKLFISLVNLLSKFSKSRWVLQIFTLFYKCSLAVHVKSLVRIIFGIEFISFRLNFFFFRREIILLVSSRVLKISWFIISNGSLTFFNLFNLLYVYNHQLIGNLIYGRIIYNLIYA